MPLDDELRRVFDALTDRVRDEVARHLAGVTAELTTAIETGRAEAAAQARAAAQQESARARAAAQQQFAAALAEAQTAAEQRGREAGRQDGFAAGRHEGFAAGRQVGYDAGRQDGFAAGREEGAGRGREQGLEEGRQEGRDHLRTALKAEALATSQRLIDAIRAIDRARSLSETLDTLASCAGREAARVGVLLVGGTELRGWRFIGFGPALEEASAFEIPLADGGIILEAVRSGATALAFSAADRPQPSFAELPPGRETLAVPVPISGQVVAVLYADQGTADSADADSWLAWPSVLEVLARHATRCLEAMTAFRAAQVLTERARVPSAEGSLAPASPRLAGTSDRDTDEAQAARRCARLLVSEIKLYHEGEVIAGRRERDLLTRLGGEIARARAMYEQSVPAELRRATDYFHAELVRTLADGDASLLEVDGG